MENAMHLVGCCVLLMIVALEIGAWRLTTA
jgi:hypothetical protein